MGKLVTFWSPYTGQAKVTSSLCAIAGVFGMKYPELSVAISHTKPDSMELEEKLDVRSGSENKQEVYKKSGISALKLNYKQALLTPEKVRRSAIPLSMKSLYLYPYTGKERETDDLTFHLMAEKLKCEFDVVFLDLESGRQENSLRFLERADLVVVVLPQAPEYWERFFQRRADFLGEKKFSVLIGGYMEASRYSRNFYSRKKELKLSGELAGVIPMNAGFLDAISEGRALDFFLKNQLVTKKEENYEFIVQSKKAAERIRKNIFLP